MSTNQSLNEETQLQTIAERYKQLGYTVMVSPPSTKLPRFLTRFHPDIVARGPNESIVIQVKSFGRERGSEYWRELSNALQKHPGWRLELVVSNHPKQELEQTLRKEQIQERLKEGQELARQRMLASSLLITWSALEAAMRLAGKTQGINLPNFLPTTIISRLYSDGLLSRDEYDFLVKCMRIRNAVSHGFKNGGIKVSMINRLQRITSQLLQE